MLERLLFEIGEVEQSMGELWSQKFLVSRRNGALVYYAALEIVGRSSHYDIAKAFGLGNDDVVGGGVVNYGGVRSLGDNRLCFFGNSGAFGGVPKEVMQKFEPVLLLTYSRIDPTVKGIDIATRCGLSLQDWLEEKKIC